MNNNIKDPNWVVGFTNGEGCFFVYVTNSSTTKLGETVRIKFQITQHVKDEQLMRVLINYFDCGNIYKRKEAFDFKVVKLDDLTNKIIPFLKKYPI